ncbi:FecR family protein [Bradyrhizobium sp. BRP22]|uniref:FecR family protein n=1 Tax=Bradyrhizobium sp. BRP22 TaxID=2793821 RepID=UPI001CD604D5|nr:FecR family protein [Bradyrhizobium sp. BRP22]MCA1454621.1 FecR family protein [Bradyrhizobium sp. BRP22]
MATKHDTERQLLEEATGWILRLEQAPRSSAVFDEFEAWLAACEQNRSAWERVSATWKALGAVKPAYDQKAWGGVDPFSKPGVTNAPLPIPNLAARTMATRKSYRRPIGMVVFTLVAACVLWIAAPAVLIALSADYRTAAGQTEHIRMADGSAVELGGSSAIKADIGTTQRRVTLLAGEGFFDVATDTTRPFIVDVRGVEVKVHGTAFNVQVSSTSTKVALLRGSIEATPAAKSEPSDILKPGQMFVVDHATGHASIEPVSLEEIGSWREGKVFLSNATVESAIELIQRYSSASILIPDRDLAGRKVSGLFDLRNPDRALAGLVEPFGGKVRSVTPFVRIVSRL